MTNGGESATGRTVSFGPFRLTVTERLLIKDGAPVAIGGRALDVLIALIDRAGEIVSARELINLVWPDVVVEEANLRVHISALRKALGDGKDGSRYVVNVPSRGYTFVAPIQRTVTAGALPIDAAAFQIDADPARPRTLPPPPQFLVGRTETVEILSALLLSRRFVSVVGPGGMGKTTVAVAVANVLRQEFGDDAVCFVDLGLLSDPAVVSSAVASALGCLIQGLDPEPYMRTFLADRRVLIVLDNCEHVIEAAASLAERLFRQTPSVHLLTTSREALRVCGENVHLLLPLDTPPGDMPSAAQALASPAVQLFMERAASSGYPSELSDAEAPIVANICRRLDGIALAIELIASRVGTYGIQGIADLLDSGAELTMRGRRDASPRHQTLQAMLDWSFRLLPADEQNVLLRLSIFVGHFSREAALSIAGAPDVDAETVTSAIAGLIDKSLICVSSSTGPGYYRLLDTTRAYAGAKLAESGEIDVLARRHASYYVTFLAAAAAESWAFDDSEIAIYAAQLSNIRGALAWSFSGSGDLSVGVELAAHAAGLLLRVSLLEECRQWCRRALGALRDRDRGTLVELELQEALAMSLMYTRGNTGEVRAAIERGLEVSENLRNKAHQLELLSGLNLFLTRRGDFGGALAAAEQSAALAKAIGRPNQSAMTAWMLAAAHHLAGDQANALRQCKLGLKLLSDFGPERVNFFGYDHQRRLASALARTLWLCGFPDQGCEVARQAIDDAEDFNHPVSHSIVLLYSIPVLHWSGSIGDAATYTERAIAHAVKYDLAPHHAVGLALKGELMVVGGDPSSGVEILREALKTMDANQYHIVTLATRRALAEGLALCGRLDEALRTIDEATTRAEQVSATLWSPDLLRARGEILLAQPRPDLAAAEESLLRSIDSARKQSALSWELKAAIPLARIWGEYGRIDDARSLLQVVYLQFTEGFETQDLVAARRLLDELSPAA
jgi:predicted ATPase/DNA-binding winged helix-turn-helix (wHTH) protein